MQHIDLTKPVEIGRDIYWIGASEEALLRRNIYLRVFRIGDKRYAMIVDPGPECDFAILKSKTEQVIGDIGNVKLVFINHQDPDVAPNAKRVQLLNKNLLTLMTEDTWRLVQFFGLIPDNFRAVEKYRNMKATLRTNKGAQSDYVLQFIPTPFCHFRGSCMFYDVNSRILFSGDFLGGISTSELYADESTWEGVKAFHQLYFPSRDALRHAIAKIRALDPQPLMIAPQHGGILKGDLIKIFMDQMEKLAVGIDIISDASDDMTEVIDLVNEISRIAEKEIGQAGIQEVFSVFHPDGSYPALFTLGSNNQVRDIKGNPYDAIDALIQVVLSFANETQSSSLKQHFLACLQKYNLPGLDLSIDLEGV